MHHDSDLIKYLESVVYDDRRGVVAAVVRVILRALSAVYRAVIWVYLFPFHAGIRRQGRLKKPVISVGNITVGGTGKTPTVQYIIRGLMARNYKPAVLSYGYGGTLGGKFGVVSDGKCVLLDAKAAGDEPVMLAKSMPRVPVLVCNDRFVTGTTAVNDFDVDILVLDDGFQVWKLYRNFEIVLLNASDLLDNERTLPAGKLREPVCALRRADCILMLGDIDSLQRNENTERIQKIVPGVNVFTGRFVPAGIRFLDSDKYLSISELNEKPVYMLSSIGNPAGFAQTLSEINAKVVSSSIMPDHYQYSIDDARKISKLASEVSAQWIVTTEKDAIKLDPTWFTLPVAILSIELVLDDESEFWFMLADRCGNVIR